MFPDSDSRNSTYTIASSPVYWPVFYSSSDFLGPSKSEHVFIVQWIDVFNISFYMCYISSPIRCVRITWQKVMKVTMSNALRSACPLCFLPSRLSWTTPNASSHLTLIDTLADTNRASFISPEGLALNKIKTLLGKVNIAHNTYSL